MTEQKKELDWEKFFDECGHAKVALHQDKIYELEDLYKAFKARMVEELGIEPEQRMSMDESWQLKVILDSLDRMRNQK